MSSGPTRILKGALWIQAALLLVLTSILADSNAWIGAVVTGLGFFLVVVGIAAAHKRRIGYLYCYATFVGLWEILALTHILIICGLIVLPATSVNAAFVVGQRVVDNPADVMKIVMPLLYGFQWGAWCITLVCLASLRLATQDAAAALEAQDPKRPHSLEASRSQSSLSGNPRMSQHLFNFRQSVISPLGGTSVSAGSMMYGGVGGSSGSTSRSGSGGEGPSTSKMHKGKEPITRQYSNDTDIPKAPERAWAGMQTRNSSDSNAIYIPNDPRISQVVVTFRDEVKGDQDQHSPAQVQHGSQPPRPDTTPVYGNSHIHDAQTAGEGSSGTKRKVGKDIYVLNFSSSGESLSDMIFKPTRDTELLTNTSRPTTTLRFPHYAGHMESAHDVVNTQQQRSRRDIPNPARIRGTATKTSLTLSSDSSSSELSALSNTSSSGEDDLDQEHAPKVSSGEVSPQGDIVVAGLAVVSVTPLNIIPKDQTHLQEDPADRPSNDQHVTSAEATKASTRITSTELDRDHYHHYPSTFGDTDAPEEFSPQMQPNSSDSSPTLSSLSSETQRSRREDRAEISSRRTDPDIRPGPSDQHESSHRVEERYGREHLPSGLVSSSSSAPGSDRTKASSASSFSPVTSPPPLVSNMTTTILASLATATSTSNSRSKSSIVPSPLQYWRNRSSQNGAESSILFTSSFPQNYLTSPFSKKKKPIIPTIIIHPDEEDGEPPRILSQKDIDYLSTMPPQPLRPLFQPWDEIEEEDEFQDGMVNEGYEFDEHRHQHQRQDRGGPFDHSNATDEDFGEDEVEIEGRHGLDGCGIVRDDEFDPYALDVSIDLGVDLRGLARDNASSGYRYI